MGKTKVLVSCDTSTNATGLGRYCYHLCKSLHEDENFIVAEQGNFGNTSNISKIPWKYYPVEPDPQNKMEYLKYSQDPENKYGKMIFDKTLLDFRPDFVVAISDPWMFAYQGRSPLREYFHWVISPTVDSIPVRDDYLSTYSLADSVFTYTDWALEQLKNAGLQNLEHTIRMGTETDVFKPCSDKAKLKESLGLPPDAFVIGSVMRNQRRKLIPDIIEAFSYLMASLPEEKRKKTYLYLHTTYPDQEPWDLPQFLLNSRFSSNILFTYLCKSSKGFGCSRFQDAITYSFSSNQLTAVMPSGRNGLSNEQLCEVYNLMDLYIQVASCEGFGVPIIEAAACGVDCAVIDYSAMVDAAKNLDLIRLSKSTRYYNDNKNRCKRVYVDFKELAEELYAIIIDREPNKPNFDLANKTKEKYGWGKCAELWKRALSKDRLSGLQGKWDAPKKLIKIPSYPPNGLTNSELVEWHYRTFQPFNKHKYGLQPLLILRDLHYGVTPSYIATPFSKEKMFKTFVNYAEVYNDYQELRTK